MGTLEEDYLKLLEELVDQQYSGLDDDEIPTTTSIQEVDWESRVSEIKERMIHPNYHGVVDASDIKSDKLPGLLEKYMNIRVGNFLIKINAYQGQPHNLSVNSDLKMSIGIWTKIFKTASGNPCNLDSKLQIHKDTRFKGREWVKLFNTEGTASKVPAKTVVEIIRWLQAINKLTAFL